jgi:hypothetical protein
MWNWLRNPKNLAVLTAVASAIGFVWTQLAPAKDVPTPTPTPSPININIDAKQINTQTMSPPPAAVPPSAASIPSPKLSKKVLPAPHQQRLPVLRQLANGIPNEILPGFWLTLEGYEGTPNNMTVHFVSPSWGNRDLSFKVGGAPFDFSHNGNTYQLLIKSMKDERVYVSVYQ